MFKKEGLILNVLLAVAAGFFMNYAIYQMPFSDGTEEDERALGWCGTADSFSPNFNHLPENLQGIARKGEEIFEANCTQCHAINEQIVGPPLKDVAKRWSTPQLLAQFIKHPQRIIDSGKNPYATALFKKYKQYMPNHDFLSDDDIQALLAYIQAWSDSPQAEPIDLALN